MNKNNNFLNKKNLMHQYIYDIKNKKIKKDLDLAYSKIPNLWFDQINPNNLRYNYIVGDILSSVFFKKKITKVLDIGSGYGLFPNYLNRFKGLKANGIEVSKYAINKGKKKFKYKNIDFGDICDIGFNKKTKFDIITIIGVFWFMINDFKICCKNLKKILKKNGKIYFQINIPKDNNMFSKKIKNEKDLFGFMRKFFYIDSFLKIEKKEYKKSKLVVDYDTFIVRCNLKNV